MLATSIFQKSVVSRFVVGPGAEAPPLRPFLHVVPPSGGSSRPAGPPGGRRPPEGGTTYALAPSFVAWTTSREHPPRPDALRRDGVSWTLRRPPLAVWKSALWGGTPERPGQRVLRFGSCVGRGSVRERAGGWGHLRPQGAGRSSIPQLYNYGMPLAKAPRSMVCSNGFAQVPGMAQPLAGGGLKPTAMP